MPAPQPSYLTLHEHALAERAGRARRMLADCELCPRACRVNRFETSEGTCKTGALPVVSAYHPHYGEEAVLVGIGGSGTIFFTSCNLRCAFCQNYEISHRRDGMEVSYQRLAEMMVELQDAGCHNINFVTPSHMVAQIVIALPLAVDMGLRLPLVYNTSAYDQLDSLRLLDGLIDLYMPDIKYADAAHAGRYSAAADYPDVARRAIVEMHRQVGDLVVDPYGLARRGLIVRHLVMPGGVAGTREVMRFLVREVSANTYVNLMDQYHPYGRTNLFPEIDRPITETEFEDALDAATQEGIARLDPQVGRRFGRRAWVM